MKSLQPPYGVPLVVFKIRDPMLDLDILVARGTLSLATILLSQIFSDLWNDLKNMISWLCA